MKVRVLLVFASTMVLVTIAASVSIPTENNPSDNFRKKRGIWKSLVCIGKSRENQNKETTDSKIQSVHNTHETHLNNGNPCTGDDVAYEFTQYAHYLTAAEYLKSNPKEFGLVYEYVLQYLEAIIFHTNEAVGLLEDKEGFITLSPDDGDELIEDAVKILQESVWVLLTIRSQDWDVLSTGANAEELRSMKSRKALAQEKVEYLRFLVWLHASDTPFEKIEFGSGKTK